MKLDDSSVAAGNMGVTTSYLSIFYGQVCFFDSVNFLKE